MLNFELSEEQKIVKKSIADMVKKFDGRREEFYEMIMKEKKFPEEVWQEMGKVGLLGAMLPEEYGGTDMGLLTMVLATEEMAAHGFGNEMVLLNTLNACCILRNGNEEQKKFFLPKIAAGEIKCALGVTEPDAGSNAFRISSLARKDGDVYKVTGQKVFITAADIADYMLLLVRTTSAEDAKKQGMPKAFGMSVMMADMKAKGLEMKPIPTVGIPGATQFLLFMDDFEVPAENLIGQENMGGMVMFNSLNPERIIAAAACLGMVENMLNKSVQYSKERNVFGQPIGAHQAIQHPLAEIKIEQEAVRLMTYKAAWAFDQGWPPGQVGIWANMAKYLAAELAIKCADRAIQTHGGYGFSEEYGIIHYWTTARLMRTAPISKELILNFIGEHVLNMPRSY
ncbi:MAG: acyl-CoA dehydrogenase family protein [bacterium]